MKVFRSFKYAWAGILYSCRTQLNFRIHLIVVALVVTAGFSFDISATEWLFVIICSILVLVFELINTAIEYLCDTITTDFNPSIKIIKDIAAGAVLVCAAGSVLTGLIIFFPKLLAILK